MDPIISSCLLRAVAPLNLDAILPVDDSQSPDGAASLDRRQHPAAKAAARLIPDLASLGLSETPPQKPKPRAQLAPGELSSDYLTPATSPNLVPVPPGGAENIFCDGCGNHSFLGEATLYECPECKAGDFCSGNCWDGDAGTCKFCTGAEKVVVPKAPTVKKNDFWTPELDVALARLVREHQTDGQGGGIAWVKILPKMPERPGGTSWKDYELKGRWRQTDTPHFGLQNRVDGDFNVIYTIQDVVVRRLAPIVDLEGIDFAGGGPHDTTPMSRPSFSTVFSQAGGDGKWEIPPAYYPKNTTAERQAMALEALRQQMVHGLWLSVWKSARAFLRIPEASRDKAPADFTVQEKQEMLRQFYHRMGICMDWYEPVAGRDAIRAKNDTAKQVLSATIGRRMHAIEEELSKHNNLDSKYDVFEQGKKNLLLPEAQKLLATIDTFGDGSGTFANFCKAVMDGIKELAHELPLLKAFEKIEDLCLLTEENFDPRNGHRKRDMGPFIRALVILIMGGKCATCLKSLLDLSIEEWGATNLDHGPLDDNRRRPADYELPCDIARTKGAMALADAVIEKELLPACDRCHPRNETAEYSTGSRVCLLRGHPPDRTHRRTPASVIVGRPEPLAGVEEWNAMSPIEREDFLLPFIFEGLWMDLVLCGAFGAHAVDKATADDMRTIFVAYLGRDWDSFVRFDAAFWNFEDTNRVRNTKLIVMNVVYSLCNWDADDELSDEDAALWGLAPQHYFSIEGDHFGGHHCTPSDLPYGNSIFMLGELASFLWPLRSATHKKRTANQKLDKNGRRDCKVERDFVARSVKNYSDVRLERMRNGGN